MRNRRVAGMTLALTFTVFCFRAALASGQTPFTHRGLDGQHAGSSVLPNEQVDAASGALTVVATDLVLPGNAGFNLSITRVYNSNLYPNYGSGNTTVDEDSWAGIGWKLHFGRIINPDSTVGGETQIEMGDGGRHPLYHQAGGNGWITTDFWVYDRPTHTLKLPNGLVYIFDREVFISATLGTVRYVTEIRDPFNNRLTFSYFDASGPPDGIQQIQQHLGAGQIRTVTFAYDATLKALATMTYNGRTWTYTQHAAGPAGYNVLDADQPPIGPGWSYQYTSGLTGEMSRLTTPSGGYLIYTYADAVRHAGSLTMTTRVVTSRATGGPSITAGTWNYSYDTGPNQDTTVVSCPCGTTKYRFFGTGVSSDFGAWVAGTPLEQTIEDNGTVLERRTFSWAPSEVISTDPVPSIGGVWGDTALRKALLAETTVTRGSNTWTTSYQYHTGLGNYNDYGRPWWIQEVESTYWWRLTTRTFQYGFTPYIVDRVASESVSTRTAFGVGEGPYETGHWTYDTATGFLTAQTITDFSSTFEATPQGNVGASIDGRGNRTTYAYTWGTLQDIHSPNTQATYSVTSDGLVSSVDNHVDAAITYTYDAGFRVTQVQRVGLNSLMYEYDNVNARFLRVGRDQAQTESQMDGFGRVISTVNRVALRTRVERDACGRTTFTSAPYTAGAGTRGTTVEYDVLGRVTRSTNPIGDVTRWIYAGLDVTQIDGENRSRTFVYRAFSGPGTQQLMSVTDAAGTVTSYAYDLYNNLTKVTGPNAGVTRTWTRLPRSLSATQPESGTTTTTLDNAGNVVQRTTADGALTTLTYDTDNRLVTSDAPGTSDDMTVTYGTAGRVASQAGGGTTTTFSYDTKGRPAQRQDVTAGGTFSSSYIYDANDNLSTLTYPSGRVVTYLYDIENRLTTVKNNGVNFAQGFTYSDNGQLASYVTGAVTHTFTADAADRIGRIVASGAGGALDLTYSYDHVSNVKAIADPRVGMSQSFEYDPVYRLSNATGPWGQQQWSYDAAGNRLTETRGASTSYAYNATTQRLTSTSGTIAETFTYDPLGRLTADGRGTYTYNPRDLLSTFARTGVSASYTYDPSGLRLSQTVNGQTTYTFRDAGGTPLSEYRAPCGTAVWASDLVYAGGRLLGAVKSTATLPTVSVTSSALTTAESGSRSVSFTLTTPGGGALGCAVTASYQTTAGSAVAGADYTLTSGTLTFAAGSANGATQSISIPILTDVLDEADETFFVDLVSVAGGVVGSSGRTTVTITDDDPMPALSINDISVTEGHSGTASATFTVSLSAVSGRSIQVAYTTSGGTATSGTDFLAMSGVLTVSAGSPTATISIPVVGDRWSENTEQFSITLSGPVNVTLLDGLGVGSIVDDDPRHPVDFNRDGRLDLLWQRDTGSYLSVWFMVGTTAVDQRLLTPGLETDLSWRIVSAGDIDADGKADVLWRHQTTGAMKVWLMDDEIRRSEVSLVPNQVTDLANRIVATGDFNGDGSLDLVWQHDTTGALTIWLMSGTSRISEVPLGPGSIAGPNWKIRAVADLNGDGMPDVIWQDQVAGYLSAWLMNGTQLLNAVYLTPMQVTDTAWVIRGAGDLDADGQPDLIWQHATQDWISAWLMNGTQMNQSVLLTPPSVSGGWKIAGPK